MPWYRPTVQEIARRRISDFEYEVGPNARVPGTVEHALAVSGSGTAHGLHGRQAQIARNAFAHTAEDEAMVQIAAYHGVFQYPATKSSTDVIFSGVPGTVIPLGTIVTRSDGFEYETTSGGVMVGNSVQLPVLARVSGAAGNGSFGFGGMQLQTPIPGALSTVDAPNTIRDGRDAEDFVSLRSRLLERLSYPLLGGGPRDYVRWAKQVPGVTRAWEYGLVPKVGNVTVLFMRDEDVGTPFPGDLSRANVLAELKKYAPAALPEPIVQTPVNHSLSLSIQLTVESGAVVDDVRAAIIESLQQMIITRAEPPAIAGSVFYRSWITEAISTTVGEKDHKLLVPAGDVVLAQWELVTLEAADITWS